MSSKRLLPFLLCALMSAAPSALAQKYIDADPTTEVRGRVSASIDKKIAKGLHISLEEEARLGMDPTSLSKVYSTLGVEYKMLDWLKAGVGYSLISRNEEDGWQNRHRGTASLSESFKAGLWRFSVKETYQATYRPGEMNLYQNPRTAMALKARAKVSYKCANVPLEPYAGVEGKIALNGVKYTEDLTHVDYNDMYLSRLRVSLGTEWRLNKKNILDFYTLWDYTYGKDIDANKSGKLKSITYRPGYVVSIGLAYKFSL